MLRLRVDASGIRCVFVLCAGAGRWSFPPPIYDEHAYRRKVAAEEEEGAEAAAADADAGHQQQCLHAGTGASPDVRRDSEYESQEEEENQDSDSVDGAERGGARRSARGGGKRARTGGS